MREALGALGLFGLLVLVTMVNAFAGYVLTALLVGLLVVGLFLALVNRIGQ